MDDAVIKMLMLGEQCESQTNCNHRSTSQPNNQTQLLVDGSIQNAVGYDFEHKETDGTMYYPDLYSLNTNQNIGGEVRKPARRNPVLVTTSVKKKKLKRTNSQTVNSPAFSPLSEMPHLIDVVSSSVNGNGSSTVTSVSVCTSMERNPAANANDDQTCDGVKVQVPLWLLNAANMNSLGLGDCVSQTQNRTLSAAKVELIASSPVVNSNVVLPKSSQSYGNGGDRQPLASGGGLQRASQQYQQLIETRRQQLVSNQHQQLSYSPPTVPSSLTKAHAQQTLIPPQRCLPTTALAAGNKTSTLTLPPLLPLNAVGEQQSSTQLAATVHSTNSQPSLHYMQPLSQATLFIAQQTSSATAAHAAYHPNDVQQRNVTSGGVMNSNMSSNYYVSALPPLSSLLPSVNGLLPPLCAISDGSNGDMLYPLSLPAVGSTEFDSPSPREMPALVCANQVSLSEIPTMTLEILNSGSLPPLTLSQGMPLGSSYRNAYSSLMAPGAMQLAQEYCAMATLNVPLTTSDNCASPVFASSALPYGHLSVPGHDDKFVQWVLEDNQPTGMMNAPVYQSSNVQVTPATAAAAAAAAVSLARESGTAVDASLIAEAAAAAGITPPPPLQAQHVIGDVYTLVYQSDGKVINAEWDGQSFFARPDLTADCQGQGHYVIEERQGQVVGGGNRDSKMKTNESSMRRLSLATVAQATSAASRGTNGVVTSTPVLTTQSTAATAATTASATAADAGEVAGGGSGSKHKTLLLPKMNGGKFAVCCSCGNLSADYVTCDNCRRPLPKSPKFHQYPPSSSSSSSSSSLDSVAATTSVAVATTTSSSLATTNPRQLSRPTIRRPTAAAAATAAQVKVAAAKVVAPAANMVTVLSSDEEEEEEEEGEEGDDGASDSDDSDSQHLASKRSRLSPDLFAAAAVTTTTALLQHKSRGSSATVNKASTSQALQVYELSCDDDNDVDDQQGDSEVDIGGVVAGNSDCNSVERSRSPTPVRTFPGTAVKLFTYPPPPATGGIAVMNEDLYCLRQGEFLNDVIIDFYLRYLQTEVLSLAEQRATHIFSSFFYRRLTQRSARCEESAPTLSGRRYKRVKNWTKNVDLFSKDFIIIPVNESAHWYLAVICFPYLIDENGDTAAPGDAGQRSSSNASAAASSKGLVKRACVLIFDSLAGPCRNSTVRVLKEYLQEEWNARKAATEGARDFTKDTMRGLCPRCPQQNNFSDCGVYLLQYVESFFKNPIKDFSKGHRRLENWFSDATVLGKRHDIARLICNLQRTLNPALVYDPVADGCTDFTSLSATNHASSVISLADLDESDDSIVLTLPTS